MSSYTLDQKTLLLLSAILIVLCSMFFALGLLIGITIEGPDKNPSHVAVPQETKTKEDSQVQIDTSGDQPVSTAEYVPIQSQSDSSTVSPAEQKLSQPKTESNPTSTSKEP